MILCCFCGCSPSKDENDPGKNHMISSLEVYKQLNEENKNEIYIIDVRTIPEYLSGHIPNAINVPLDSITDIKNYVSSFDSKIIVYCQSGYRSNQAYQSLIELGYTEVYDMGGLDRWEYEIVQ